MKTKISQIQLKKAYAYLVEHSSFDIDFIVLISLATVICFLGFLMDSATVIIGAMVVSPLLYSVIAIPASIFEKDKSTLISRLLLLGFGLTIVTFVPTIINFFYPIDVTGLEIVERLEDSYIAYFLVALFSGIAGTFCFYWPKAIEAVTGVAISIALLPPLCILGISLSSSSNFWPTALMISLANIGGIILGSVTVLTFLYIIKSDQ